MENEWYKRFIMLYKEVEGIRNRYNIGRHNSERIPPVVPKSPDLHEKQVLTLESQIRYLHNVIKENEQTKKKEEQYWQEKWLEARELMFKERSLRVATQESLSSAIKECVKLYNSPSLKLAAYSNRLVDQNRVIAQLRRLRKLRTKTKSTVRSVKKIIRKERLFKMWM